MASLDLTIEGGIAKLMLNNPSRLNAFTPEMLAQLESHCAALERDPDVACVIVAGEGERAFCAGADITAWAPLSPFDFARHWVRDGHRIFDRLARLSKPTVAAISAHAFGGGLELAACCDLRLASDDARFGIPIGRLGGVLAYPELEALVHVAGPQVALELLLEGRLLDAQEALAKGLVTRVVPQAAWDEELAQTVARISGLAPLSARWHKKFIARLQSGTPLTDADQQEGYACFDTQDFIEGYSAFLDKRKPVFTGK